MSLIHISSPIRRMLNMNISSRELADIYHMDIKSISNKDIERLNKTLKSTKNLFKRTKVQRLLTKIGYCQPEHPKSVCELINKANRGLLQRFEGTNRDVFIDNEIGFGYKLFKLDSTWSDHPKADERLNDIYKNKSFYNGYYAQYAHFGFIEMVDDRHTNKPKVLVGIFRTIPGAERLDPKEKIPYSILVKLELLGYMPFDIKPDNFVKVKNPLGYYDYLPIDSKQIGLHRSDSERTFQVINFRKKYGTYYYNKRFVDYHC
ncbi:hypothetical protein [Vibrio parahaemolyticus]|uniref:hypothetical protein n=1 Tax=Vibrio parahaemolyticus TaxID=670 RepID=UPI0003FF366F|nr:hypothetical protein [Vibrio parahaemolyticus]ANB97524.1 hypothetical protein FORC14_1117 [Vibrio parahaemolyticus]EGQ9271081.1 hypothetical protein [Vibrio parahaemolyticus]EGQ9712437.1 hypothetical protein [Vibrio parahaemolyticus]EIA0904518.1 hypothetical protein [Vibrio parahaemolyticus]EIK4818875.1 hypothetical protein [Vibrio parahaemolyticus]